jgi:hypothetical protein
VARPHGLRSQSKAPMTSADQLAATVANALKSTGARTEQGKRGALLTGRICLLTAEENQAARRHCAGIRESLEPVGVLQLGVAQSSAEDRWRLKRARALETRIFALSHLAALALQSRDDAPGAPLVNRRSKKPNCLPILHIAKAKSTIRRATSGRKYCRLGPIFRASARPPDRPESAPRRARHAPKTSGAGPWPASPGQGPQAAGFNEKAEASKRPVV